MATSAGPGAGWERDRPRLLGGGPVLVVHPPGAADTELAARLVDRLRDEHVWSESESLPVSRGRRELHSFTGLVVALAPPDPGGRHQEQAAQVVRDYREERPRGLAWLLGSPERHFGQAGVVQIVAPAAVLDDDALAETGIFGTGKVCARHRTERTVDLLAPYRRRHEPVSAPTVRKASADDAARYLHTWGVRDLADVPRLRECIDAVERELHDPRYRALSAPVEGIAWNRLTYALWDPAYPGPASKEAWSADGGRVWRIVLAAMVEIVPDLSRPGGRHNTKNAQKDLHDLYHRLCAVEEVMSTTDPSQWPVLAAPDT